MIHPKNLIERWQADEEVMRSYGQAAPADVLLLPKLAHHAPRSKALTGR